MKSAIPGLPSGLLGVIIFSGSLPATRVAVADFTPLFLTAARAAIAACLAALLLLLWRQSTPHRREWRSLVVVASGVVIAFPLLTALALQNMSAARSLVFIGLLPLTTAVFGAWCAGERPGVSFWVFSLLGAGCVLAYAVNRSHDGLWLGDIEMIAAILCCAAGYCEGAILTRRLGGCQVICWALIIAACPMIALALAVWPPQLNQISLPGWLSLGYVSIFSMLAGFIFWYHGLAKGGIAVVGQLQLLQPFIGLGLTALLLHEPLSWSMVGSALAVLLCVALARRVKRPG